MLRLSPRVSEALGLRILHDLTLVQQGAQDSMSAVRLAEISGAPILAVETVLYDLQQAGLIVPTADEPARYILTRAAEDVLLSEALSALRAAGEHKDSLMHSRLKLPSKLEKALTKREVLRDKTTLKDLI